MIDDGDVLMNHHSNFSSSSDDHQTSEDVSAVRGKLFSSSRFTAVMIPTVSFLESGSLWNYPHYYNGTYYL